MTRQERLLYHQIHPLKLLTDWSTAAVAAVLLWRHQLVAALLIGFLPSILVSLLLIRYSELEPYRTSAFGRYIAHHMTRAVEAGRFVGLALAWDGAWPQPAQAVLVPSRSGRYGIAVPLRGANTMSNLLERITLNPEIRSGKPVIRGTRITVSDILEYLAGGMSEAEILQDFPDLHAEDISAALTFAAERERRLFSAL